ncbi:MAG: hypothetical protein PQ964_03020 [Methanobacteriaceae archaeon]|jgi:hypothetical protein
MFEDAIRKIEKNKEIWCQIGIFGSYIRMNREKRYRHFSGRRVKRRLNMELKFFLEDLFVK